MKTGTKKFLYTIFAVILALGLGIGAILLSMLNVQASTEMMPGIEQILDEKSEETPFRILELVNNSADAEIGYYISGQEPYLSQYKYTPTNADGTKGETQTFSSVEEGLSVLPTKEQRQKFVEAKSDMVKNPSPPALHLPGTQIIPERQAKPASPSLLNPMQKNIFYPKLMMLPNGIVWS